MLKSALFIFGFFATSATIFFIVKGWSKAAAIISAILAFVSFFISLNPSILNQEKIEPTISMDINSLELLCGTGYTLSATISPEDTVIEWVSSNSEIVTIDNNGNLKAINEGTATITAVITYNNKKYASDCIVTVKHSDASNNSKQNEDNILFEEQETIDSEISSNNDSKESDISTVSIKDIAWLDDEKIYKDDCATTMRGEEWLDCIRFGSSNINSDGTSVLRAVCDQKYSKFTAEIAPQEGFDKTESVILYIYGATEGEQTFKEEFQIDYSTKAFKVEYDLSSTDELYFWKSGDYNQGRIAGQYINGYTGMGVLMRDAILYK